MSLDLVLGSMWAGKSSHAIGQIRRYKAIGWSVLVIVHALDTRYGSNHLSSHDEEHEPAFTLHDLSSLETNPVYASSQLIVIEEAQFFTGLYSFVKKAVERDGKRVICIGLDGDANRKPFGEILQLIPLCDSVTKLQSLCADCKDGTPALFSHRIVPSEEQVQVGAENTYEPLCRNHFLAKNPGA